MDAGYIFNLVKPCMHRDVSLEVKEDVVYLDGNKMDTMRECDEYLEAIPRKDLEPGWKPS